MHPTNSTYQNSSLPYQNWNMKQPSPCSWYWTSLCNPSLQWINSPLYSMRGDPLFTFPFVKTPYPIIQNRNMNWSIILKTTFLITAFPHSVKSRVKIVARYMTLPDSKILFFEKNLKTTKNVWPFNQRDSKNT